ncbi:MAG: glycosyltransferase [Planctomycetota bacterium]|nr:MAG: glycosyltransferase [Planctomycetota bacterium]REK24692.1 MAG: glycosyltransferase [Planctomycetota bacterium]REK40191.1 MAG: glycosyltransferase [Planctomycetota bacterium]
MIVDHFNAGLAGGAAIAARRIHDSLRDLGVDSRYWHFARRQTEALDASYRRVAWPQLADGRLASLANRVQGRLRRNLNKFVARRSLAGRPEGYELFTLPRAGWKTPHDEQTFAGQVLHLHWLGNALDYPSFFATVPDDLPIVWTLHDMNPLTGGCHYAAGCENFRSGCGNCPQLGRCGPRDLSARSFEIKEAALVGKNLHIVAVGKWLERLARTAPLTAAARSFQTIHCGLDLEVLRPGDRAAARRSFDLPSDCTVVGFGADSIDHRRKGLRELLAALSMLKTDKKTVGLVFGGGELPGTTVGNVEVRNVGFIAAKDRLAEMYAAMDLFAMPSLEEAFGMTGLEAMACGVPVVGFDTGGIIDYVRPRETGLLARVGDAADLATNLETLVDNPQLRRSLGQRAREMVEREFEAESQAHRYLELYQSLTADRAVVRPREAA